MRSPFVSQIFMAAKTSDWIKGMVNTIANNDTVSLNFPVVKGHFDRSDEWPQRLGSTVW